MTQRTNASGDLRRLTDSVGRRAVLSRKTALYCFACKRIVRVVDVFDGIREAKLECGCRRSLATGNDSVALRQEVFRLEREAERAKGTEETA